MVLRMSNGMFLRALIISILVLVRCKRYVRRRCERKPRPSVSQIGSFVGYRRVVTFSSAKQNPSATPPMSVKQQHEHKRPPESTPSIPTSFLPSTFLPCCPSCELTQNPLNEQSDKSRSRDKWKFSKGGASQSSAFIHFKFVPANGQC